MFNTINHLLFETPLNELDNELLETFSPYMVSRYLSFYSEGDFVDYTNDTINTYSNIFKTKEDQFIFFEHVIPKLKRKKINYIKKIKKETSNIKDKPIELIPEFYSKREINFLTYKEE